MSPMRFRGQIKTILIPATSAATPGTTHLANSERFYAMARSAYEADKRSILDCTVSGACQVFQKARLEDELK